MVRPLVRTAPVSQSIGVAAVAARRVAVLHPRQNSMTESGWRLRARHSLSRWAVRPNARCSGVVGRLPSSRRALGSWRGMRASKPADTRLPRIALAVGHAVEIGLARHSAPSTTAPFSSSSRGWRRRDPRSSSSVKRSSSCVRAEIPRLSTRAPARPHVDPHRPARHDEPVGRQRVCPLHGAVSSFPRCLAVASATYDRGSTCPPLVAEVRNIDIFLGRFILAGSMPGSRPPVERTHHSCRSAIVPPLPPPIGTFAVAFGRTVGIELGDGVVHGAFSGRVSIPTDRGTWCSRQSLRQHRESPASGAGPRSPGLPRRRPRAADRPRLAAAHCRRW